MTLIDSYITPMSIFPWEFTTMTVEEYDQAIENFQRAKEMDPSIDELNTYLEKTLLKHGT